MCIWPICRKWCDVIFVSFVLSYISLVFLIKWSMSMNRVGKEKISCHCICADSSSVNSHLAITVKAMSIDYQLTLSERWHSKCWHVRWCHCLLVNKKKSAGWCRGGSASATWQRPAQTSRDTSVPPPIAFCFCGKHESGVLTSASISPFHLGAARQAWSQHTFENHRTVINE